MALFRSKVFFSFATCLFGLVLCWHAHAALRLDPEAFKARLESAAKLGQPVRTILFLGNSHTYVNDVPDLFERIAATHPENTFTYVTAMLSQGGARLLLFVNDKEARHSIDQFNWDYIVLQDNSVATFYDYQREQFFEAVAYFAERYKPTGTQLVLYSTWPRQRGNELYIAEETEEFHPPRSPNEMNKAVEGAYREAAQRYGAAVAPVGKCWLSAADAEQLYMDDGNHARLEGSFLAALVLFRTITGLSPVDSPIAPTPLNRWNADILKQTAERC